MKNGQPGSGIEVIKNGQPDSNSEKTRNGHSGSGIEEMKNKQPGSGNEVVEIGRSGSGPKNEYMNNKQPGSGLENINNRKHPRGYRGQIGRGCENHRNSRTFQNTYRPPMANFGQPYRYNQQQQMFDPQPQICTTNNHYDQPNWLSSNGLKGRQVENWSGENNRGGDWGNRRGNWNCGRGNWNNSNKGSFQYPVQANFGQAKNYYGQNRRMNEMGYNEGNQGAGAQHRPWQFDDDGQGQGGVSLANYQRFDMVNEESIFSGRHGVKESKQVQVNGPPFWRRWLSTMAFFCCGIGSQNENRPTSQVTLNGTKFSALWDTGADLSVMSYNYYKKLKVKPTMFRSNANSTTASGQGMSIMGRARLQVTIGQLQFSHEFTVLESLRSNLII